MQAKHNSYVVSEKVTAFREPPYIHVTCVVLDLAFKFSIRADFFFLCFPQRASREETRESPFSNSGINKVAMLKNAFLLMSL